MTKKKATRRKAPAKKAPAAELSWIARDLRPLAEPIDTLELDPQNARTHDEANVKAIAASLARYGLRKPIVCNRKDRQVEAGNGTLLAARQLGWTHLAVVWVDDDPAAQVGFSIGDNRTAELATWDDEQLAALLEEYAPDAPDLYDDLLMAELLPETPAQQIEDPEPQIDRTAELQKKWKTKLGQVWEIPGKAGVHRVMCGDCRDAADVARLCVEKVNGSFTSPPYAEQRKEQYGGVPADKYVEWWEAVQANVRSVLAEDGSFFVNIKPHAEAMQRSLYVWDVACAMSRRWKWLWVDEYCWLRNGIPQRVQHRFKNSFEPVYWFAATQGMKWYPEAVQHPSRAVPVPRGKGAGDTNAAKRQGTGACAVEGNELASGMAYPDNVLDFREGAGAKGHPAAFPVRLPSFFMRANSQEGDRWFDPFLGSGTTLIAAEQLSRVCYGMEISPGYVAVILQRTEDAGLQPRLGRGRRAKTPKSRPAAKTNRRGRRGHGGRRCLA